MKDKIYSNPPIPPWTPPDVDPPSDEDCEETDD